MRIFFHNSFHELKNPYILYIANVKSPRHTFSGNQGTCLYKIDLIMKPTSPLAIAVSTYHLKFRHASPSRFSIASSLLSCPSNCFCIFSIFVASFCTDIMRFVRSSLCFSNCFRRAFVLSFSSLRRFANSSCSSLGKYPLSIIPYYIFTA